DPRARPRGPGPRAGREAGAGPSGRGNRGLTGGGRGPVLELLVTHPQHQGKGVGKALLDWGVRMADQKQARIYLEATPEGYPLYRKCGWRDVEDIVMDYSVYGGEGEATYAVMIREPALPHHRN
ncbi:hypothetical protein KXW54_009007, partial [Aspergillus fumigatus]